MSPSLLVSLSDGRKELKKQLKYRERRVLPSWDESEGKEFLNVYDKEENIYLTTIELTTKPLGTQAEGTARAVLWQNSWGRPWPRGYGGVFLCGWPQPGHHPSAVPGMLGDWFPWAHHAFPVLKVQTLHAFRHKVQSSIYYGTFHCFSDTHLRGCITESSKKHCHRLHKPI